MAIFDGSSALALSFDFFNPNQGVIMFGARRIVAITLCVIGAVLIFVGLSGMSDGAPSRSEARAEALVQWEEAGEVGQEIVCKVYNDEGVTEEDLVHSMISGDNRVSWAVAKAKLDIFREEC